jgi:phosphoribosyl 1,2-cyclic phosphate phosphodiesterase
MRVEFLGTGGAIPMPRAGCRCRVCVEARQRGRPYARNGPGIFVHGPDLLIDTSEDVRDALNRSSVSTIGAATYSHWHPDHTAGLRIWESLNWDLREWPPRSRTTQVYLPARVALDFKERGRLWEQLKYLQGRGIVAIHVLDEGEAFHLGSATILPVPLHEMYVYAFLIEDNGKRIFIAMDELHGWQPPDELGKLDLAIIPKGIDEFDPLMRARLIPADHPVLKSEATMDQTLEIVRRLDCQHVVMAHIEELDQQSFDDLIALEVRLQAEGSPVRFAYDGMILDI